MKKYENFCNALKNLEEIYDFSEPYNNVVLTGLVGLYEICFEQSWKAMKELLYASGVETAATGSPKAIIKEAYGSGMIRDEQLWLNALIDRNNVAHAYNQAVALEIVNHTKKDYVGMFQSLKKDMEENWI